MDSVHPYLYDSENRIIKVDNATAYAYDGEGKRVRKYLGENTRFVYGIGGELLIELSISVKSGAASLKKEYVYCGGTMATIEPSAGTQYATTDILSSPRVITDSNGNVVSRHDYMPFGEELFAGTGGRSSSQGYGGSETLRKKFTGYERDSETGLDFAQARYYASTNGRFNSPDPLASSATTADPQSWNRYAYVGNNPMTATDPSGMIATRITSGGDMVNRGFTMAERTIDPNGVTYASRLDDWVEVFTPNSTHTGYTREVIPVSMFVARQMLQQSRQTGQGDSGETETDTIPRVLKVTVKAIDVAKDPDGNPYKGLSGYDGQEIADEVAECGMFELTVKYVSNVGPDFPNSSQTIELQGRIESEATLFKGPAINFLKSESDTEKFVYEAKFS